jgi:hypothetical protein
MGAPGGVFAAGPPLDARVFASGAADLRGLSMPEPEDRKGILISSAVSALLHLLVIGGIAGLGYVAQQAAEKVIPVVILNPPIALHSARESSPQPVPEILPAPMAIALPLRPSDLAAVPAPMTYAPSLELAAATALGAADARLASLAELQPAPIAVDLIAPRVELAGRSGSSTRRATNLAASRAFKSLAELNTARYQGAAVAPPTATRGSESGVDRVATGISVDYIAAGSAGGDPNLIASAPDLQIGFVQRYLEEIKRRTYARWEPPLDAGPDDFVQFRIAIDHAGAIAKLELIESTSDAFAASAMAAFKSAAPFPPLNDDNRRIAEATFRLTFRNPELP